MLVPLHLLWHNKSFFHLVWQILIAYFSISVRLMVWQILTASFFFFHRLRLMAWLILLASVFFSSPKTHGVTSFDRKKQQKLITPPTSNFVQSNIERDVVTKIQSHMATIQMLRKLQPLASTLAETPPGSVPTSFSSAGQEDCLIKLPCAVSRLPTACDPAAPVILSAPT